jgi:hypothetical protein
VRQWDERVEKPVDVSSCGAGGTYAGDDIHHTAPDTAAFPLCYMLTNDLKWDIFVLTKF